MWAEQSLRGCSRREHRRLLVHAGDNERAGFGGRDQSTLRVRCVRDINGIKIGRFCPFEAVDKVPPPSGGGVGERGYSRFVGNLKWADFACFCVETTVLMALAKDAQPCLQIRD